jgi:predicted nucleic acid-binding protein
VPPRGRPPTPRGVYSFEDASIDPPDRAVLDTSFVVEAVIVSQPAHVVCQDYFVRLALAGTTIVFNELLEIELQEAAFQLGLKERHPRNWKRYRGDGRSRPRAAALADAALAAWEEAVSALPHEVLDLSDVSELVPSLMRSWGLASYDAIHAATAIETGTSALVTRDAGFGSVPSRYFDLYVDSSRVASCRTRRR